MFILNPYDRYCQKSNNASGAQNPLSDSTNSPSRRLVESITRSRKASPVVSVTTASANSSPETGENSYTLIQLTRNCIPFPSIPVPIPSKPQTGSSAQPEDGVIYIESSHTPVTDWYPDVHQRPEPYVTKAQFRSRLTENSCLPIGNSTAELGRPGARPRLVSGGHVSLNKEHSLKKILESAQCRRISRNERNLERRRTKKAGKKIVSDIVFLVALHKTIAWRIECATRSAADVDVKGGDEKSERALNDQDKLLAHKLLVHLVERGHDPHTLLQSFPSTLISTSSDLGYSTHLPVENPTCVPCVSRPFTCSPTAPSSMCLPVNDTPLAASPPGILTMPQVVASLILRHRDSSTVTRPRPSLSPLNTNHRSRLTLERKSPLSKMYTAEVQAF